MILYYAVGGGLGHLTRARSFLHAAGAERDAVVLTASPFATDTRVMGKVATLLVPAELRADGTEYRTWIRKQVSRIEPTTMVLDTFPAGLFHELDGFAPWCDVEYVARYLRWPQYTPIRKPMRFSRSWVVEPLHAEQERFVVQRSAIVDRRPTLIDPPDEQLHAAADIPSSYSLVIHSGAEEEVDELIRYAEGLREGSRGTEAIVVAARLPSTRPGVLSVDAFPALTLARNAVRIITAAGFNAMRQFGGDPRHHALPFPRRFDDQFLRASRWRVGTPAPAGDFDFRLAARTFERQRLRDSRRLEAGVTKAE